MGKFFKMCQVFAKDYSKLFSKSIINDWKGSSEKSIKLPLFF